MLKHLPKDSLTKIEKTMLYSNHNSNMANDIANLNINKKITKFQDQFKNEFFYRIPLRYFTDLGKINFPLQIDFTIKCHVKTDMKK